MYRPASYIKEDKSHIFSFIQQNPFATMVSGGSNLIATHIPVLLEGHEDSWVLYSHMANHNDQRKRLVDGEEALLIFQGPHAYISSSWYREKDISTWDYSAVHVNASIRIQSREELENSLEKLVNRFEREQQNPLYYKDLPEKMLKDHLPLITGFWLDPFKMEAIAKLHQSYPQHDKVAVANKLEQSQDFECSAFLQDFKKENKL